MRVKKDGNNALYKILWNQKQFKRPFFVNLKYEDTNLKYTG